ncbi:MAG: molybdopterin molybdotransferase MoeA [Pseudomonadota bacterium]
MITVDEALGHVFALADRLDTETVPLRRATGRVLAAPVTATRAQPPFRASIMDGYAVAGEADTYRVVGEIAAGGDAVADMSPGEAVRIFTGAPVPNGAMRVVIQEDVTRAGDIISIHEDADKETYIREIGRDFNVGDQIDAPRRMTPALTALAAAMNCPEVTVSRRPKVAFIATGDELVMPGEAPAASQIIASNGLALAAIAEAEGAEARLLPIAADTRESLEAAFALTTGVDLIVTIGGASVGDYDLVGPVAKELGLEQAFYKIAMRPGKPLMAGRLAGIPMLGLPGNPVSSIVCGHIFMRPLLRAMQGLPHQPLSQQTGTLAAPIGPNGPREHYMRASRVGDKLTVAERQDSALLTVLADADVLVVRPPHDPALEANTPVSFIEF